MMYILTCPFVLSFKTDFQYIKVEVMMMDESPGMVKTS